MAENVCVAAFSAIRVWYSTPVLTASTASNAPRTLANLSWKRRLRTHLQTAFEPPLGFSKINGCGQVPSYYCVQASTSVRDYAHNGLNSTPIPSFNSCEGYRCSSGDYYLQKLIDVAFFVLGNGREFWTDSVSVDTIGHTYAPRQLLVESGRYDESLRPPLSRPGIQYGQRAQPRYNRGTS